MTEHPITQRSKWNSRLGFILAAAGSAVGLGNIWKFPYITGENGGGLFVLIYLVCIVLVGLPIMVAEIMIGRAAQKQPVGAFEALQGHKTSWTAIGWMGVLAGFIILSFYAVVAGWAMDFTLKSVVDFTSTIEESTDREAAQFVAKATPSELRSMLIDDAVSHDVRDFAKAQQRSLLQSTWDEYQAHKEFLATYRKEWDKFLSLTPVEDQRALLTQGRFEQQKLLNEIDVDALRTEVQKEIADLSDEEVLARLKLELDSSQRLLSDPKIAAAVAAGEAVEAKIAERKSELQEKWKAHFAAVPLSELEEQARTIKRRELIFNATQSAFLATATDGWTAMFWTLIFMGITTLIVGSGIASGIERTCQILMPLLLVLIVGMVVYGMFQPGFKSAFNFVFYPDPSKLKPSGVLEALGHAFFTLSLGMGAMLTYGSYQDSKSGLIGEALAITFLDTLIALLACLMIFPIAFSYGQEPSAGPGLVFMSMPLAFAEIGRGGMLLAIGFFGLLFFAALTSAVSLLEVVTSYLIDQKGWHRHSAAWSMGAAITLFAIPSAFALDENFVMSGWETGFKMNFFDTMDYLASNWLLPLGGLFIALYAGWGMPRRLQVAEVQDLAPGLFWGWLFLVRIVAPILVIIVLLQKVRILDIDMLLAGRFNCHEILF